MFQFISIEISVKLKPCNSTCDGYNEGNCETDKPSHKASVCKRMVVPHPKPLPLKGKGLTYSPFLQEGGGGKAWRI